jgi:hypothetical protein
MVSVHCVEIFSRLCAGLTFFSQVDDKHSCVVLDSAAGAHVCFVLSSALPRPCPQYFFSGAWTTSGGADEMTILAG